MPAKPHGGVLVDRIATGAARDEALARAATLPRLQLSEWSASDLDLIGCGAFSPLTGFMGESAYRSVVDSLRLPGGEIWSLPVIIGTDRAAAASMPPGTDVALIAPDGGIQGIMTVAEQYSPPDREADAVKLFRTADPAHPGVRQFLAAGDVLLGGPVTVLNRLPAEFPHLQLDPAETRRLFAAHGWQTVVGFQTRNPIHRAHEYLQKCALEMCDGLFIHPLVGQTKADDVPAAVRVASYEALLEEYYPPDRVVFAVYPAAMRYAGPREAVLHAIVRKNYGCTHFIVGRDHAGVGNYYGTYDAQRLLQSLDPGELGITPLCFEHAFYCRICGGMTTAKTCPHDGDARVTLSGTRVRELLRAGEVPPPEYSRPEVAAILAAAMHEPSALQNR